MIWALLSKFIRDKIVPHYSEARLHALVWLMREAITAPGSLRTLIARKPANLSWKIGKTNGNYSEDVSRKRKIASFYQIEDYHFGFAQSNSSICIPNSINPLNLLKVFAGSVGDRICCAQRFRFVTGSQQTHEHNNQILRCLCLACWVCGLQ